MTNHNRLHKYRLVLTLSLIILGLLMSGCSQGETPAADETPVTTETPMTTEAPGEDTTPTATPGDDDDITPGTTATTAVAGEEPEKTPEETPAKTGFIAKSPVSVFSDEDIAYLGINLSGDDRQVATGIKQWQETNMIYASPDKGYNDAGDPIHWNYFLPGIWSSKDIIYTHTDNGKIYGICHDFAIIYCSIGEYYGLECRVMNTLSKPGDVESQAGMLREEYDRNKSKLDENGLDYSYAAVNTVAEGTPTHYWAEVYLDGEWTSLDGTQVSTGGNTGNEYIATGDFEVTDWLSRDKSTLLDNYAYTGITDDLGRSGRAANMNDVLQGIAPAPYFNDVRAAVDFVGAGDSLSETDIREAEEDRAAYESCSGGKLNLVVYFICDGDDLEGIAWVECYERYSDEKLDIECALSIVEGS